MQYSPNLTIGTSILDIRSNYQRNSYKSDILKVILNEFLKLEYETVPSTDGEFGHGGPSVNDSSGVIRDILDHTIDISTGTFDMTYDRSMLLSFGPTLDYSKRALLVNKNFFRFKNDFYYWSVFTESCLALVIGSIVLLRLYAHLFKRYRTVKSISLMIAVVFMLFSSLFNSEIIGTRSTSTLVVPFSTIEQSATWIEKDGYTLITDGIDSAPIASLLSNNNHRYFHLQHALKRFPIKLVGTKKLFKMISLNEKCFGFLDYRFGRVRMSQHGVSNLDMIPDRNGPAVMQGMLFSRSNPKLKEIVTVASLRAMESGILVHLQRYYGTDRKRSDSRNLGKRTISSRTDPIKLNDLFSTFLIYFCIMLCSFAVVVFEYMKI